MRAALAAALILSVATPARAEYCRTKACDNHLGYDDVWQTEPDPACDEDAFGCRLQGQVLYWPKSCLSFAVQQDGSKKLGIDFDTAHDIIEQAFATWMSADCGGGATPSLRLDDLSPAVCNHPELNSDQGNANVFMFRDDDWPHEASPFATLALTTVTYNRENAQIYDADVEVNSHLKYFSTTGIPGDNQFDLLAVLTHETGHFLGLSHDDENGTTMYAQYSIDQSDLADSDIRGICDIYPADQPVSQDACVPRHGYLRTCATTESKGCAISPERANGARSLGLVAVVGLGLLLRRTSVRRAARR